MAHKTYDQIWKQCAAQGVPIRDTGWLSSSSRVLVGVNSHGGGYAIYDCDTGRFFGKTPAGVEFNSDHQRFDGEAWFDALVKFFAN